MIITIGIRELKSLFLSPLAWSILAVVQLILAYLFLGRIELFQVYQPQLMAMESAPGVTEIILPDLLGNAAIILLLVVPLLTMRLVAEERRNRTLALLFSAPLSMTEIVLGKYLGILLFFLILLALIALMPLSLLAGAGLDLGLLASGFLGLALLLFWILDWSGQGLAGGNRLAYLSLFNHYKPFLDGIFDSADAVYHLLLIATFLVLSIRRLDADRLGG